MFIGGLSFSPPPSFTACPQQLVTYCHESCTVLMVWRSLLESIDGRGLRDHVRGYLIPVQCPALLRVVPLTTPLAFGPQTPEASTDSSISRPHGLRVDEVDLPDGCLNDIGEVPGSDDRGRPEEFFGAHAERDRPRTGACVARFSLIAVCQAPFLSQTATRPRVRLDRRSGSGTA